MKCHVVSFASTYLLVVPHSEVEVTQQVVRVAKVTTSPTLGCPIAQLAHDLQIAPGNTPMPNVTPSGSTDRVLTTSCMTLALVVMLGFLFWFTDSLSIGFLAMDLGTVEVSNILPQFS